MTATIAIDAAPDRVFAVLADPASHQAIDGTGWVRECVDDAPLTEEGQVFRMAMYHENHPDKDYEMANRVEVFDRPRSIAWQPGQESPETGELGFGGWDLALRPRRRRPIADDRHAHLRLVGRSPRGPRGNTVPPFGPEHLDNSLEHLSELAAR